MEVDYWINVTTGHVNEVDWASKTVYDEFTYKVQ